jgi:protein-S-isoprenylcysteine O-methyltransferase Ste14
MMTTAPKPEPISPRGIALEPSPSHRDPLFANPRSQSSSAARGRDWAWLLNLVARKRALLTSLLALLLIGHAWWTGIRPRDPFDVSDPWAIVGLWLVLFGVGLRVWAAGTLHKATTLTTTGPYSLVRHPLYVGSYLMMLGFCALLADWVTLLAVLGPLSIIYMLRLRREERTLSQRFGEAWRRYAQTTPRFLPRAWRATAPRGEAETGGGPFSHWRLSLWRRNHEYRASSAALLGLVMLKLWHAAG